MVTVKVTLFLIDGFSGDQVIVSVTRSGAGATVSADIGKGIQKPANSDNTMTAPSSTRRLCPLIAVTFTCRLITEYLDADNSNRALTWVYERCYHPFWGLLKSGQSGINVWLRLPGAVCNVIVTIVTFLC